VRRDWNTGKLIPNVLDGPIIYGTGLNDDDRKKAWKHFFRLMIQAVDQQQGKDTLGVKLARRCLPDRDFCTTTLDANLVGIGGLQEPERLSFLSSRTIKQIKNVGAKPRSIA
jgi:hypothetical protein